ncbi:E3 ubiquitin-protein ligase RNF14-like [Odontesthes bonariensis]|uniref:E3 ubiquitin-protein ligase RNF14-like n=1 Tax=Odontesthes bonariensis TaxID=219752 RepID=UPI003F583175
MNTDSEEQEDELLVLQSIFSSEEFVRDESKFAGEIRVSAELPADFIVVLKDGDTLRQYDVSSLPPLLLTFELPEDYPSSSPPSSTLTCSWLNRTQLIALSAQLANLHQATGGAVVLFSWIQFLKEDALKFLDIYTLLELPSDEHSTLQCNQSKQDSEPSKAKDDEHTPNSDICAPSGENLLNSSASNRSSTDSHGASGLDCYKADQHHLTSHLCQISLNADYPKNHSSETGQTKPNQIAHAPDTEAFRSSEFKADNQDDPLLATGKSELIPFTQSEISQEDVLSEGDSSAVVLPPTSSSSPLDPIEQVAASLPTQPTDSSPYKAQNLSGLSLSPSQLLLSQILIHDAAQKQKVFATTVFDCGICYMGWLGSECMQLYECAHIFCQACLREFCQVQITEGNIQGVTCPQAGCVASLTPAQVKSLVGEKLFSRYDRLLLQSTLDHMSDVTYCPRHSCGSVVIADKSSNAALCSVCSFAFCVTCKKTYHGPNECHKEMTERINDDALQTPPQSEEGLRALLEDYMTGSKQRRRLLESRYGRKMFQSTETYLSNNWKAANTKACPHCFCPIQKDGGCDHMYCTQCHRPFCWV